MVMTAIWDVQDAMAAAAPLEVPPGQRQLFLDDEGIARIEHLSRTMHRPVKRGAVIRPTPNEPEVTAVQIRTAPIWAPARRVWKLWDCSTPRSLHARRLYCGGYHESADGLHWTRPAVGQVEHRGSRENHYISFMIRGRHCRPDCVVYDRTDPDPARRYKAAVPNVGFAVSPDGVTWTALDVPGVPSSDEYNLSFDEQAPLFILTVKRGGPYGRSVALSTSKDFERWTRPELVFHADERDQRLGREHIKTRLATTQLQRPEYNDPNHYKVDVYNMAVFRYESVYVGLPSMYHETGRVPKDWTGFDGIALSPTITAAVRQYGDYTGFHHVQLACSRDLRHWSRLGDRRPFIDASPLGAGAYDLQCIIAPSCPVVRGDELWLYYTGIKHYAFITSDRPDAGAVCLAVLRRDGFVSLDAGEQEGAVITRPFAFRGRMLCVNVDARRGWLRGDVLDASGKVIAASQHLEGDQPHGRLVWKTPDLGALKGQKVTLRFSLCNARLYAYWVEN